MIGSYFLNSSLFLSHIVSLPDCSALSPTVVGILGTDYDAQQFNTDAQCVRRNGDCHKYMVRFRLLPIAGCHFFNSQSTMIDMMHDIRVPSGARVKVV